MVIIKILIGILLWFGIEISIALGVSVGLRVYFEGRRKDNGKNCEK